MSVAKRLRSACLLINAAHFSTIAVVAAVATLTLGCENTQGSANPLKRPWWMNVISAPTIDNEEQLNAVWQSAPRCCSGLALTWNNRIFYKACVDAIDRHPNDENLVVKCMWLMPEPLDPEDKLHHYEFMLDRYFDHRDSLYRCVNCAPGDTITRTASDLASMYWGRNRIDEAIALLERVLDRRGDSTSPWVLIETTTQLGQLYAKSSMNDARMQRMTKAYDDFGAMRGDETIARRWHDFEKVARELQEHAKRDW